MAPHILILGAGVGGLILSSLLGKNVKDRARITVIDRKSKFEFTARAEYQKQYFFQLITETATTTGEPLFAFTVSN